MTVFDDVVLEETRRTIVELVKMETIFSFYSSLATLLNSRILDACGSTMHGSRMETIGTFLTKG